MSLLEAGVSLMFSPVAQHYYGAKDWVALNRRNDANAPAGFFKTRDGSYVAVFASYPALWERFIEAMGVQHLANDPRFVSRNKRTANSPVLHEIMGEIFATEDTDHWVELLTKAGVPTAPVRTAGQMVENDQVLARDLIVDQEHPTAGPIRVIGVPVKLSETPGKVRTPAPLLGEHTHEIVASLGHGDELESLEKSGVI